MSIQSDYPAVSGVLRHINICPLSIKHFTNGYCHQVYLIECTDAKYVLRITDRGGVEYYKGSLHWLPAMSRLGIAVPQILQSGEYEGHFFALITYIEGKDLGDIYPALTSEEKRGLAESVAAIQKKVSSLSREDFYGYTVGPRFQSWKDVVKELLDRAKSRISLNCVFSSDYIDAVSNKMALFDAYFAKIQPVAFLDDVTTKNVLIHDGRLSGIVDIDEISYGDPLFAIGLTHMALLYSGHDTEYIIAWMNALELTEEQREAERFYALLFCVDFMGEQGMAFNNGRHVEIEQEKVKRLTEIFYSLL